MPAPASPHVVLYYEAPAGTQSPVLRDPGRRCPEELLAAWTKELNAQAETLRHNRAPVITFRETRDGWPAVWSLRDVTSRHARIPRLELSTVISVPSTEPWEPIESIRDEPKLPTMEPAWVEGWLAEVTASLGRPATDEVAAAAIDYTKLQLRTAAREQPSSLAVMLFESYLIFAVWKAQQQGDDDRGHRLAIALQEVILQTQPSEPTVARPPDTPRRVGAFVSAVQQLVGGVLPGGRS